MERVQKNWKSFMLLEKKQQHRDKHTHTHAHARSAGDRNDMRRGVKVKSETIYKVWNAAGAFRSLASFLRTVGGELALWPPPPPPPLFNHRGPDRTDQWLKAILHSAAPPPSNWMAHERFTEQRAGCCFFFSLSLFPSFPVQSVSGGDQESH